MPRIPFSELPDHGRVWVFPASRRLDDGERAALLVEVDAFLDGWAAHGAPLRSGRELLEGHFLAVAVDEDASRPSGCSIDALVNRLEALAQGMGIRLVDHAPVWYRQGDEIRVASREEFRARAKEGVVDASTRVFDTSLTRLADLRRSGLERPAGESWHGRAFFSPR
ncbi:MAG: hypothetical protein Q8N53_12670 [Longimicrobiales bacterium]|nr:hypothetical protein [Longimicrobiales bacterium]